MQHGASTARRSALQTTVLGTLVVICGLFDTLLIGLPIVALAAWLDPLVVFVLGAVAVVSANGLCCTWLDREWDGWLAGPGRRIEGRLDRMRTSRLLRHPVAWVQRESDRWFALGAAVTNAITATVLARLLTPQPLGPRRILLASLAYGLFFVGLYTFCLLYTSPSPRDS